MPLDVISMSFMHQKLYKLSVCLPPYKCTNNPNLYPQLKLWSQSSVKKSAEYLASSVSLCPRPNVAEVVSQPLHA